MKSDSLTTMLTFTVMFVLIFILGPFALIWACNTLFGLSITYTFMHWLAGSVLLTLFKATARGNTLTTGN